MEKIKRYCYQFGYKTQWAVGLALAGVMNFAVSPLANAATPTPAQTIQLNGVNDLVSKVLCPITNAMFDVLMVVSVLLILWASYLYITAQDDSEKVTRATKTITYAAVGIAIALIALVFPTVVGSIFNVSVAGCNGASSGGSTSGPINV